MSKYITGQEVIQDLGLHDFEFYNEYVRAGLTPLNAHGQPYSPRDVMAQLFNLTGQREALFQLNDSTHDLDGESVEALRANRIIPLEQAIEQLEARLAALEGVDWADFALPANQGEAQYILGIINNSLFDRVDVVKMIRDNYGPRESEVSESDVLDGNNFSAEENSNISEQDKPKPVHHTIKDKLRVQAKARELLDGKYKGYYAPQLADTDEILTISKKKNGKFYSREKIIEWINEVLTDDEKLKGAPPKIT